MINIVNQAVNNYRQRIEKIIQVGKKCLTKECSRNHRDSLCSSFEDSHESTVNGSSGYSDSQRRVVILCGRLKCGKTSFLNELLDCSSNFPDGEEPATGIFVRVKYSESEYWKLYRIDEESQHHHHHPLFSETLIDSGTQLESHNIHRIIQNRSDSKFYSRLLDVGVLSDILKCGLDIVDTPGLGENAELDRFVLNYVPHLKPNLILYLFDFKPKFDLTDRFYVRGLQEKLSEYEHCSAEAMQYLIIATKVDVDEEAQHRDGTSATVYDQGEVDQLIETFLCDGPHDCGDRFLPVYPVSADIIHEIRAKKSLNKYRETENYSTHENYFRNIQQKITAKLRRLRIEEYLNCCQEMMKEIRLLICGQINTDKSSFLASLLGRTVLLPSSDLEAFNRLLLKIDYNHTPFLRKEMTTAQGCCEEHDVILPLPYREMISHCDDRFIVLHLGYPFDVLESGIHIIHSPGLCAADNPMDCLNIVPNIIVYLYDGRLQQLTSADKLNIDRLKEKFSSIDPIRSDCVQWILIANSNVECRQSFSLDEALSSLEPLCSRQNCEEFLPLLMFTTSNTAIEADDTTNSDSQMLTFCQCLSDKLRAYTLKLASNFAYWGIHILDFYMDRTSDQQHLWIDYWYEMKTLSVDDDLVKFVQSDHHQPLINFDDAFKVYLLSNCNQFTSEHLFVTELSEECAKKISFAKEKENIYACQWRTRDDIVFLTRDENSSKIYVVRRRRLDAAGTPTRLLSTLKEMPESRVYRIIGKIFELYDQPKIYKQFRPDLLCIDEHDNVFHEFEVPNHHDLPLVLADCRKVEPFHLHPLHNQHYPNIPLPYRLYRFGWCLWIILNRGLRQPVEEDRQSVDLSSDLETSNDEHSVVNEMIKLCVNVCTCGEERNVDHVWRHVAKLYHKLRHSVPTSH